MRPLHPHRHGRAQGARTGRPAALLALAVAVALPLAAAPARAADAPGTPMPGMDMPGMQMPGMQMPGMQTPQPAGTQAPATGGAATGAAQAQPVVGTSQQWEHPEDVAGAALVQVQTYADVSVAVHSAHLHHYQFTLQDHDTTTTGFVVNPRGTVLTSSAGLALGSAQEERYAIAAVNEGFRRAGVLPQQADPYVPTHVAEEKRFEEGPAVDLEERLQSCYQWHDPMSHCAVFMQLKIRVVPLVGGKPQAQDATLVWSDKQVAVLATSDVYTPLTGQLGSAEAGAPYWAVAPHGSDVPQAVKGTLTGDPAKPLSDADLTRLRATLGPAGAGVPLVSETGDVIGMLGTAGSGFEVLPAAHLSADAGKAGITMANGPLDTQFRDGLRFLEARQYRAADTQLAAVATSSGGQTVAVDLDRVAADKKDGPEDMTDEANHHHGVTAAAAAHGFPLRRVLAVLVVLALALAGWLAWRRRTQPSPAAPSPGAGSPGAASSRAGGPGAAGRAPAATAGAAAPSAGVRPSSENRAPSSSAPQPRPVPAGAGAPGGSLPTTMLAPPRAGSVAQAPPPLRSARAGTFCPRCGSQLSPGDRFCFSCGDAAR